jgi:hypothetical protein
MSLLQEKINWTGSETSQVNTIESVSIPKEEARKRIGALQKKISAFLTEAVDLYLGAPTNELGSVILLAENIERELEKLK